MAKSSLPKNLSIDNLEFAPLATRSCFINLTGRVFERLTVLGYAGQSYWWCQCSCGNITRPRVNALQSKTQHRSGSCGCLGLEKRARASRTHGMSDTKVHYAWSAMLQRCRNPREARYHDYGGRGISVCARWFTFENFYADMGNPPTKQHSLERIDNNGNYEPDNCKWATPAEQQNNLRNNRRLTVGNVTQTYTAWARISPVARNTIVDRIERGWEAHRAVFHPPLTVNQFTTK